MGKKRQGSDDGTIRLASERKSDLRGGRREGAASLCVCVCVCACVNGRQSIRHKTDSLTRCSLATTTARARTGMNGAGSQFVGQTTSQTPIRPSAHTGRLSVCLSATRTGQTNRSDRSARPDGVRPGLVGAIVAGTAKSRTTGVGSEMRSLVFVFF